MLYVYNVDIKLIPFEICLIYKPTYLSDANRSPKRKQIHKQKKTEQQGDQTHSFSVSIL